MTDLLVYDAPGRDEVVAKRDVSPAELLEAAIARAEARKSILNFIDQSLHDRARHAAAGRFEGPFAGVPFLVKDLHSPIAGERTEACS